MESGNPYRVPCADVHKVGEELGRVHVAERVVGMHQHEGPHATPLLMQGLDPRFQILRTKYEALIGGIGLRKQDSMMAFKKKQSRGETGESGDKNMLRRFSFKVARTLFRRIEATQNMKQLHSAALRSTFWTGTCSSCNKIRRLFIVKITSMILWSRVPSVQ